MRPRLPCAPGRARPRGFSARHSGRDGPNEARIREQGAIGCLAWAFGRPRQAYTRRRDAHHVAQDANRERLALILDDAEFHFGGSEKMRSVF